MYKEIIDNLENQLSISELNNIKYKQLHLGIFSEPYLTFILNGQKTIESRFSKNKILPYNKISKDDIVIVKKSGGNIVAYFTIKKVLFFDLNTTSINEIKDKYNKQLCVDDSFWISKKSSNYVTLIIIDKLIKLKPFHINKKGMQTWIRLNPDFDTITINEIMQDTYFFYMLLELKRKLNDIESKSYLTMFIKGLAITVTYELAVCLEKCGILDKDTFFKQNMKKRVREERQWLHQDITNSKKMKDKIEKMGLNFDELVYDLNLIVKDGKILDMNFEQFGEYEDLDFWNSVFYLNEQVMETIFKVFDEKFKVEVSNSLFDITDKYLTTKILDNVKYKIDGIRYSYSSFKLFNKSKNLEINDKIFILYRYRLVSSIIMIDKIFKDNKLKVFVDPLFSLDFNNYLRKYRALVICILGNDLMKLNTLFSRTILNDINNKIDEKFFPLNRKMRDNIHYTIINIFSNEDLLFLDEMQYKYLNIIYNYFIDNTNLNIDDDDILMTNFLNCCREKGLTPEEIKENYENLYLEYYYTRDIDNQGRKSYV